MKSLKTPRANRPSKEWTPVGKKTVSAKAMSKEEFETYRNTGAHPPGAHTSYMQANGWYDGMGKWHYDAEPSAVAITGGAPTFTDIPLLDTGAHFGRCYETHPAMPLGNGLVIYGGSCHTPMVKDADIYVALDGGYHHTGRHWPWHPQHCQEIEYPISDMSAPKSVLSFGGMITWLAEQITAGKRVHVGCIGGHGRTGMVLAAVYAVMNPTDKDAIQHVRKNYCKKAVEVSEQVQFLVDNFGVTKAPSSKSWDNPKTKGSKTVSVVPTNANVVTPMDSARCIWGSKTVSKQ